MEHKSYYPKTRLTEYAVKTMEQVFGLFLFAAGAYLMVQANIGLSSWWAFPSSLCSALLGLTLGRNIHQVLDKHLMAVQNAMDEKLMAATLADIVEETKQAINKESKQEEY